MPKCRLKTVSNPVALVGVLAFAASFVAAAEEAKPATAAATPQATAETTAPKAPKKAFYSGSAISYGHAAGASDLNPSWSHHLELVPEFHVGNQFFVRARFSLEQEFTDADAETGNHEVYFGDIGLETGVAGWTIPVVGIHVAANVRLIAPTSKASQNRTLITSVGPALSLSRRFNLLSGVTVAYAGRLTQRFHRFTEPYVMTNQGCASAMRSECRDPDGINVHTELNHGPALSFSPIDVLTFATTFQISHKWRYAPTHVDGLPDQQNPVLFDTVFDLSASWQMFKPVGLTLGASTFTPGLNAEGSNKSVFFNRNTTLYLDATVDIEAAVKGILGDPT
jgi:hypothetical protein